MKQISLFFYLSLIVSALFAQVPQTLTLNKPDLSRGFPVMKALSLRSSASVFDEKKLSLQDLSDLLWAANGINRPDNGKRTAPSAMNSQDVDIYVCMPEGSYLYDAVKHALLLVSAGDHRALVAGRQENMAKAPVFLVLVSDISRFRGDDDSLKMIWAAVDVGTVSQNIALFCSGTGLETRPRASMDQEKLRQVLKGISKNPMLIYLFNC